jgi:hypothetical protein
MDHFRAVQWITSALFNVSLPRCSMYHFRAVQCITSALFNVSLVLWPYEMRHL